MKKGNRTMTISWSIKITSSKNLIGRSICANFRKETWSSKKMWRSKPTKKRKESSNPPSLVLTSSLSVSHHPHHFDPYGKLIVLATFSLIHTSHILYALLLPYMYPIYTPIPSHALFYHVITSSCHPNLLPNSISLSPL